MSKIKQINLRLSIESKKILDFERQIDFHNDELRRLKSELEKFIEEL